MRLKNCATFLAVIAVMFIAGVCAAQVGNRTKVVIRPARLLDVKSGKLLEKQAVVVEGGRITQVADAAKVDTKGAQVIDLPAATILPGLIDTHTHLTFDPVFGYESLGISIPREALIGAKNARITLLAGFTTVRNVGADGFSDVALRDSVDAGELPGPHMLVSGPALGRTGGHCDDNLLPFEYHHTSDGTADGPDQVIQKVRQNIKYGATVIKVCATGGVMSKGDDPNASEYTQEELRALVNDAHRLGRRVAAHAHGSQGILWAAEAGVDSVEHGSYIDDAGIAALKKHGTYLVPQIYIDKWLIENAEKMHLPAYSLDKEKALAPLIERNLGKAIQSGVKIAYGTDSGVIPHGMNAYELPEYVKAGMTPLDAIRTATVNAADLLGWSDRTGSIESGKWADLIAVDGDPTKDIELLKHVRFVMKSGEVYKNEYAK